MNQTLSTEHDRARRRAAIESIIARYPSLAEHEIYAVFDYFRHDATSADRRRIARNRAIYRQYRQFCRDHRLDRLGRLRRMLMAALMLAAVLTAILLLLPGAGL